MASLQALEEDVEAFCRERAQADADAATGRTPHADAGAVERAHPGVVSRDTLAALEAAAESPRTQDAHRPRLLALLPFLRHAAVEAEARPALDALERARKRSTVHAAGTQRPLLGAWSAVAEEADTQRRAALARASAEAELALLGTVQRRWEAVHSAGRRLGVAVPQRRPDLEAEATDFLAATEDAWRDVLAFACRRLDVTLRPLPHGDAGLQDLLRLAHTPLPGVFPQKERLGVLRRWLLETGLTLEAEGRLRVEDGREAGLSEAACFAVEVPERVHLVLPANGRGAFSAVLDALGRARATAAVSTSASLAARRLGDASVRASAGLLFRGVLTSAPWLRRFLGLGRAEAKEVARLSALVQLGELRMLAARLPLLQTSEGVGPSQAGVRTVANAVSEALFLQVPEGTALPALEGWPGEAEALRAAALAEAIKVQADERFDAEDFRNPSAARWLSALWARGADVDADALAEELGGKLSLGTVGRRLQAVLGA
jgi:hypothetical protein